MWRTLDDETPQSTVKDKYEQRRNCCGYNTLHWHTELGSVPAYATDLWQVTESLSGRVIGELAWLENTNSIGWGGRGNNDNLALPLLYQYRTEIIAEAYKGQKEKL